MLATVLIHILADAANDLSNSCLHLSVVRAALLACVRA